MPTASHSSGTKQSAQKSKQSAQESKQSAQKSKQSAQESKQSAQESKNLLATNKNELLREQEKKKTISVWTPMWQFLIFLAGSFVFGLVLSMTMLVANGSIAIPLFVALFGPLGAAAIGIPGVFAILATFVLVSFLIMFFRSFKKNVPFLKGTMSIKKIPLMIIISGVLVVLNNLLIYTLLSVGIVFPPAAILPLAICLVAVGITSIFFYGKYSDIFKAIKENKVRTAEIVFGVIAAGAILFVGFLTPTALVFSLTLPLMLGLPFVALFLFLGGPSAIAEIVKKHISESARVTKSKETIHSNNINTLNKQPVVEQQVKNPNGNSQQSVSPKIKNADDALLTQPNTQPGFDPKSDETATTTTTASNKENNFDLESEQSAQTATTTTVDEKVEEKEKNIVCLTSPPSFSDPRELGKANKENTENISLAALPGSCFFLPTTTQEDRKASPLETICVATLF